MNEGLKRKTRELKESKAREFKEKLSYLYCLLYKYVFNLVCFGAVPPHRRSFCVLFTDPSGPPLRHRSRYPGQLVDITALNIPAPARYRYERSLTPAGVLVSPAAPCHSASRC